MNQQLLVVRNGVKHPVSIQRLRHGADGNVQTLRLAAAMVRQAETDEDLRRFAEDLVKDCAPTNEPGGTQCQVEKLFEFARDGIRYIDDPPDTERIADAWATIETRAGDCGDKSILLASLLATVGCQSQFIVQNFHDDVLDHGFDHVHIEAFMPDGSVVQLDPTPRSAIFGWEAPSAVRMRFPIWSESPAAAGRLDARTGVSGLLDSLLPGLIGTGEQIGSSFAQGAMQSSRQSAAVTTQINSAFNSAIAQAVTAFQNISARLPNVTADDLAQAQQIYQALANFVSQHPTSWINEKWNDPSYSAAFQHDLNLYQQALAGATMPATAGAGFSASASSWLSSPAVPIAVVVAAIILFLRKS